MTDRSGFLASERGWKLVLAGAVSVLVVAVVVLVARTGDPASADSYLTGVRDAVVVLPNGTTRPATEGMRVPAGALLRTGAVGAATLRTAGRDVFVGGLSTLQVLDGVRQDLQRGEVMVDSRNGPRLALTTPAGVVAVAEGALARVEEGVVLRLGVFEGTARLTAAGRQATTTVTALHQSKAAYGGLGQSPTALALTDDAWERQLAAGLVSADLDLKALARGLAGAEGEMVLQSASARLQAVPPASVDVGEQALAMAVAQASTALDPVTALRTVQSDRADGGSWGVVAALVSSRVSAVSALLDGVLAPPGSAPTPVQAGGTPDLSQLFGPPSGPTGSPSPTPGRPSPTPSPTRRPTPPPPTSSPVDQLVTTVTGLLSPSPTPPSVTGTPTPTPILQIGPIRIG